MNEEDKKFFNSCDSFKDYSSIEEYTADIRRWLTLSSWHYSEEEAKKLTEDPIRKEWIQKSFDEKEPVSDIAADVGYFCG